MNILLGYIMILLNADHHLISVDMKRYQVAIIPFLFVYGEKTLNEKIQCVDMDNGTQAGEQDLSLWAFHSHNASVVFLFKREECVYLCVRAKKAILNIFKCFKLFGYSLSTTDATQKQFRHWRLRNVFPRRHFLLHRCSGNNSNFVEIRRESAAWLALATTTATVKEKGVTATETQNSMKRRHGAARTAIHKWSLLSATQKSLSSTYTIWSHNFPFYFGPNYIFFLFHKI